MRARLRRPIPPESESSRGERPDWRGGPTWPRSPLYRYCWYAAPSHPAWLPNLQRQRFKSDMTLSSNSIAGHQRPDAAALFKRTDANGDGKITKDELTTALQNAPKGPDGTKGPNVDDLFSKLDADGNGEITEVEHEAGLKAMGGERGMPPPPPPPSSDSDSSSETELVDTLKKLLEALAKKDASSTTTSDSSSTDSMASTSTSDATSSSSSTDSDIDTLIKKLVEELKKNSETTGVLRATA